MTITFEYATDVAKKNVKGLSLIKAEEDVIKRIVKNH